MSSLNKKVLFIDLEKNFSEVKTFPDFYKYIGGVGLGLKLYETYQDEDPIIFSVGPLNGFFPFVSKTSVVFNQEGVIEDLYLGGYLSTRIRFADLDSVVIMGVSSEEVVLDLHNNEVSFKGADIAPRSLGLPGKRSFLNFVDNKLILDDYFSPPENFLEKKFIKKRLSGLSITGTNTFAPKDKSKYEELYKQLLDKTSMLAVEKGFFPSCSGCPMGCAKSNIGEMGGNVLSHSLVACAFADNVYTDVGTVFSCLNILGYDYTHEDIENLPVLVQNVLKKLN